MGFVFSSPVGHEKSVFMCENVVPSSRVVLRLRRLTEGASALGETCRFEVEVALLPCTAAEHEKRCRKAGMRTYLARIAPCVLLLVSADAEIRSMLLPSAKSLACCARRPWEPWRAGDLQTGWREGEALRVR